MKPETTANPPIRACVFSDEVADDFEEAVRLAAEAGAEGLELRGKMWGRSIRQIDDADVARIRRICAAHGVRVAVIGSPIGKCGPEDPEELRDHQQGFSRMIELAHAFETPLIRAFSLWRPDRKRETDAIRPDMDRWLDRIVAFMEPLVALAEREAVRYCLETEGACMVGTCAEANRVLDALGRPPALGLAWDLNNCAVCGETPYPEGYALIRDRVYHVHVKPNPQGSLATVWNTPATYEEVLATLRREGYAGWASIEHWGTPEAMLRGVRELVPVLQRVNGGQ